MRSMTGATVAAGIGILVLVIITTFISVSFATRGAMAANRPIVEVLHFVGAGDSYIANRFLRHFHARPRGRPDRRRRRHARLRLLRIDRELVFRHSGWRPVRRPARDVCVRPSGYLVLAGQALLIAAITAWASRRTLFATLDDID